MTTAGGQGRATTVVDLELARRQRSAAPALDPETGPNTEAGPDAQARETGVSPSAAAAEVSEGVTAGEADDFALMLAAAQQGDDQAWTVLFNTYGGPLRGYLYSKGAAEPDDLLSEVFVDLARRLHAFEGSAAQFRSWLFMIAHNRVVDERRHRNRRPVSPTDHTAFDRPSVHHDTEAEAVRHVMATEALAVVDSLTPDQRAVLRLRLVEGLTLEEVADQLGKPVGAIKALQRRGLAAAARVRESMAPGGTPRSTGDGNNKRNRNQDF